MLIPKLEYITKVLDQLQCLYTAFSTIIFSKVVHSNNIGLTSGSFSFHSKRSRILDSDDNIGDDFRLLQLVV